MTIIPQANGIYTPPTSAVQPNQYILPNPNILGGIYVPPNVNSAIQPNTLGEVFKPKKAGKNKSHIIFILDDSASMQSCREATIKGFNEYLDGQQIDAKTSGIETFVSLYKFDGNSVNCAINHVAAGEVEPLNTKTYNPRGGTNLLDALGGVMMKINEQLSGFKKSNRESIIITLLTDGQEINSRTFTNADIKMMVEKAEAKNWGFMFLGANVDAFAVGSSMGFSAHSTVQYDTKGSANAICGASAMTSRLKSAYSVGTNTLNAYESSAFTESERTMAMTPDDK